MFLRCLVLNTRSIEISNLIRSLGESYLGYFKPYFDASQILIEA